MMNALEKAKLIKELQDLGHDLDHRSLALYEIARSKKRIRDIFELCDEPIFKKQNLAFKTITQPDVAAYEFAADSLYNLSFRGFFLDEYDLEKALYTYTESGWAFLYNQRKGWQIWLIPAPNRTALISEWTDIEQSYAWLLHEQSLSTCLKTDLELKASAAVLSLADAEIIVEPTIVPSETKNEASTLETNPEIADLNALNKVSKLVKIQNSVSKAQKDNAEKTLADSQEPIEDHVELAIPKVKPEKDFSLDHYAVEVIELKDSKAKTDALFELKLKDYPDTSTYIEIILNYDVNAEILDMPMYMAEQLQSSGQFHSYLLLIGASSLEQAQQLLQHVTQIQSSSYISIKPIHWQDIKDSLLQFDQLSTTFNQVTETVWQQESYYPYISAQAFSPRKYMLFDEAVPHTNTPILLLEERQKLRVIHGEKRLKMSAYELAYPCIILKRDKALNWQSIHMLIADMPKPISVQDLYLALQSQITA